MANYNSKTVEIKYNRPRFYNRLLANLIDAVLFILIFFGLFLGSRAIVISTPTYQANEATIQEIKLDSGIYKKDVGGAIRDVITVLNTDDSKSARNKKNDAKAAINSFLTYCDSNCEAENASLMRKSYDDFRLEFIYDNTPCFTLDNGEIKETGVAGDAYYYKNVYSVFVDEYCQAYLIKYVPQYYEMTKYMSNVLIYAEIIPSYLLSGIVVYLLPTFIFRRGRKTFGKAIYRIGLVDKRVLNCTWKRSLARFAIFYFGELVLSLFSFGLPFIVSFSIMVFSKKKQGFPDYMLGLDEVDTSKNKIYNSMIEITMDEITPHKKAIDFSIPIRR